MSTKKTELLLDVVAEIRKLEGEISDRAWEGKDVAYHERELAHYRQLEADGILWEPRF